MIWSFCSSELANVYKKKKIHLYCFLYKIKRITITNMALRAIKVFQVLDCIKNVLLREFTFADFSRAHFFFLSLFFTFYIWSCFYRVDETKATNREWKWFDNKSLNQMNSCTVKSRNTSCCDLFLFFSFFYSCISALCYILIGSNAVREKTRVPKEAECSIGGIGVPAVSRRFRATS